MTAEGRNPQKELGALWPDRPRRLKDATFDYRLSWIRTDGRARIERFPRGSGRFIVTVAVGGTFAGKKLPAGGTILIGDYPSLRRAIGAADRYERARTR